MTQVVWWWQRCRAWWRRQHPERYDWRDPSRIAAMRQLWPNGR